MITDIERFSKSMDIEQLLHKSEFPKSSRYEKAWMQENQMGSNAL